MRPAPKLRLVSAFNALAYRNIAMLQDEGGLTLGELQFLGGVAGRLKAGSEMMPEEVARISAIRAALARRYHHSGTIGDLPSDGAA